MQGVDGGLAGPVDGPEPGLLAAVAGEQLGGVLVVGVVAQVVGEGEQVDGAAVAPVAYAVPGGAGLGVVGFGGEHPVEPGQALGGTAGGGVQLGDVDGQVAVGPGGVGGLPDGEGPVGLSVGAQGVAQQHGGEVLGGEAVGAFGEVDGVRGVAEAADQAGGEGEQDGVVAVVDDHPADQVLEGAQRGAELLGGRVGQDAGDPGGALGDAVGGEQSGQVGAGQPGGVGPGPVGGVADGGGEQGDRAVPVAGGGLDVGAADHGAEVDLAVEREVLESGGGAAGAGAELGEGFVEFGQLRVGDHGVGEVLGGVREVPGVDGEPGDGHLALGLEPLVSAVRVLHVPRSPGSRSGVPVRTRRRVEPRPSVRPPPGRGGHPCGSRVPPPGPTRGARGRRPGCPRAPGRVSRRCGRPRPGRRAGTARRSSAARRSRRA